MLLEEGEYVRYQESPLLLKYDNIDIKHESNIKIIHLNI